MKNKLIAIDLDGSLVNNASPLPSPFAQSILNALIRDGNIIVIASGRPYLAVKDVTNVFVSPMPFICYNGAKIVDPNQKLEKDYSFSFSKEIILDFYKKVKDKLTSFMCGDEEIIIEDKRNPYLEKFFLHAGNRCVIGNMDEVPSHNTLCAFEFINEGNNEEEIKAVISNYPGVGYRRWSDWENYAELYFLLSDKGAALKEIAKAYGFNQKDIIAFGDSGNDYGMLKASGIPFAMKNYISPRLKEFPKTEKSCAEDGVAWKLKEMFSL